MSTVGFATEETSDDFAAVYNTDKTVSVSADEWAKVAANDNNNQYTLVIVPAGWIGISEGDTDASDDIFYINQDSSSNMQEDVASVAFLNDLADGTYEVRVGSDNNSFDGYKVATFVVGGEEDVRDFITATVEGKATLTEKTIPSASAGKWITSPADTDDVKIFTNGKKVKIALDTAKYPLVDATDSAIEYSYMINVVDNSGNAVPYAEVFYSASSNCYIALVPGAAVTSGYKFEVTQGKNEAIALDQFGEVNGMKGVNVFDANSLAAIVFNRSTNTLTTNAKVIAADVDNSCLINVFDANMIAAKAFGRTSQYTIEQ